MSKLIRVVSDAHPAFIVVNTYQRRKILADNFDLLDEALDRLYKKLHVRVLAYVWLPDHAHIMLPTDTHSISSLMHYFKMSFTRMGINRGRLQEGRTWQSRFWDHVIRNARDLQTHLDYIHYNPVKHGYTTNPFQWRYSSIHWPAYVNGYAVDWGKTPIDFDGKFGE